MGKMVPGHHAPQLQKGCISKRSKSDKFRSICAYLLNGEKYMNTPVNMAIYLEKDPEVCLWK